MLIFVRLCLVEEYKAECYTNVVHATLVANVSSFFFFSRTTAIVSTDL